MASASSPEDTKIDPLTVESALIAEDAALYLGVAVLQVGSLFFAHKKYASFIFFGLLAVITVYLGSKRQDIPEERTAITNKQAATAPILASISLLGIYTILRYTDISVGIVYQYITTFVGVGSAVSILVPALKSVLPKSIAEMPVSGPLDSLFNLIVDDEDKAKKGDDQPLADLSEIIVLLSALCAGAVYLNPGVDLTSKFVVSNVLAWCIGMQSIGVIAISSFRTALLLLGGLFLYDIYWVFGTDVMMTVATQIEAPVKFLYPVFTEPMKPYPFSVLGLGDIVIPATFCTLMRTFDAFLADDRATAAREAEAALAKKNRKSGGAWPWASDKEGAAWFLNSASWMGTPRGLTGGDSGKPGRVASVGGNATAKARGASVLPKGKLSYFDSSVKAYALGLGLCFAVNLLSQSGQPALLYLNPMLVASAIATALANGEDDLKKLLSFESSVGAANEENVKKVV
ncbi:unnamed protein product [Choristocarpus tenellus]